MKAKHNITANPKPSKAKGIMSKGKARKMKAKPKQVKSQGIACI
jgi:hypothetical protein